MAKDQEKKLAKIYFVNQGKTAKEIAQMLSLTEKTVSNWVNSSKPSWKELRNAHSFGNDQLANDFKELVNEAVEKRQALNNDPNATAKDKYKATIEIRMLNAEYQSIVKKDDLTLEKYVRVMEDIFNALQNKHPKLFIHLLDFQEEYLNEIAIKMS